MAIYYNEDNRTFYLHSKACTFALGINGMGLPEQLYFGSRVGNDLCCGSYFGTGKSHKGIRIDDRETDHDRQQLDEL